MTVNTIGTEWNLAHRLCGYTFVTYLITAAGIWLSATAYLNPAEPDIMQYHGGFLRRSDRGVTAYQVNENHQDGGRLRLPQVMKPGDGGEICGSGFMRMQQPLGSVLIWFVR